MCLVLSSQRYWLRDSAWRPKTAAGADGGGPCSRGPCPPARRSERARPWSALGLASARSAAPDGHAREQVRRDAVPTARASKGCARTRSPWRTEGHAREQVRTDAVPTALASKGKGRRGLASELGAKEPPWPPVTLLLTCVDARFHRWLRPVSLSSRRRHVSRTVTDGRAPEGAREVTELHLSAGEEPDGRRWTAALCARIAPPTLPVLASAAFPLLRRLLPSFSDSDEMQKTNALNETEVSTPEGWIYFDGCAKSVRSYLKIADVI